MALDVLIDDQAASQARARSERGDHAVVIVAERRGGGKKIEMDTVLVKHLQALLGREAAVEAALEIRHTRPVACPLMDVHSNSIRQRSPPIGSKEKSNHLVFTFHNLIGTSPRTPSGKSLAPRSKHCDGRSHFIRFGS